MKTPFRLVALAVLPLALVLALAPAAPVVAAAPVDCPATNVNGCFLSGTAVLGEQTCCVYAGADCPRFERTIGPCS